MMATYTADFDDNAEKWVITHRDADNMPVDQFGQYDTEKKARRAAAQKRYTDKTYRPAIRRP